MSNLITIENLTFGYEKGKAVFNQLNLNISSDCHKISLIGADGVGKSTLIKLLFGIIKAESGSISFFNQNLSAYDDYFLSYMPQESFLYEELSVLENLKLANRLQELSKIQKENELLKLLDKIKLLAFKDYKISELSGGMKQKIALACSIIGKPKILLLDEPTVGVDPISRIDLWEIIDNYLDDNTYCLYSTAYLDEAQKSDLCLALTPSKLLTLNSDQININCNNLCFYLEAPHYLNLYYDLLMLNFENYILDLSLELGKIRIIKKPDISKGQLLNFLHEHFSNFKLEPRIGTLEDLYFLTLKNQNFNLPKANNHKQENKQSIDLIKLHQVKKVYGSFVAVDNSTFTIKSQEIFGLLGPNGAGKTTTFRMMCGLLDKSAGQILINNMDLTKSKVLLRAKIGYVSQKFSLYSDLSSYQNICYFGNSYGLTIKQIKKRLEELLPIFPLQDYLNTKACSLPFGVQRELSMIVALLHEPSILFLDEATSGADIIARRKFFLILNLLKQQGVTIVVTTHFLEEAEFCDRFLIQDKGKIICLGKPDEICLNAKGQRISVNDLFLNKVKPQW